MATPIYVNPAGLDTNTGVNPTDSPAGTGPLKTVTKGYEEVTAGGIVILQDGTYDLDDEANDKVNVYIAAKNVTFQGNALDKTAVELIGTSGQAQAVQIQPLAALSVITFNDMTITGNTGNATIRQQADAGDPGEAPSLVMSNCIVTAVADQICLFAVAHNDNKVRNTTLLNCTMTSLGTGKPVSIQDADTITITGGTYTGSAGICVHVLGTVGKYLNTGSQIASLAGGLSNQGVRVETTAIGEVYVDNNAITAIDSGCFWMDEDSEADFVYVTNNTMIGNTSGTAQPILALGDDAVTVAEPSKQSYIAYNTCQHIGSSKGHGIAVYGGFEFAYVFANKVYDCSGGIVMKSSNVITEGNVVTGTNCIQPKGAAYCKILRNTAIATGGAALIIDDQTADSDVTEFTMVYDNIFTASGAGVYCVLHDNDTNQNNIFDNNCYYAESSAVLFKMDATEFTTLLAMQTKWDTFGLPYSLNDDNSLNENPQFVNPPDDFSPQNSDVLHGGRLDVNENTQPIGSVSPIAISNNRFAKANRFIS